MKQRIVNVINKIKKLVNTIIGWVFPDPDPVPEGEACCTYRGMWKKVLFYTGMIVAGLIGYFVIHNVTVNWLEMPIITVNLTTNNEYAKFFQNGTYDLSVIEWIIFLVTFLSITITPVLRFIPKGTVFIDTLYCISVGYNTSFMYWSVAQDNPNVASTTFYVSAVLCLIPYVLFKFFRIKLPAAFNKIVYVLFWVLVMGSTICRILMFIPGISYVAVFFYNLYNLPGAGEFLLFVRIVIYFLFIFICLNNVIDYVRRRAPVKYEWTITFHLVYTITILINYCLLFVMAHLDTIMQALGEGIKNTFSI